MIRMPYQKQLKVPVTFPAVLSKSRDYNCVVEYLLYTIFNYFYTQSVESKNIHNPFRCSTELLPMLAEYYRYQYTNVEDIALEREIIATISELHHNKGCVIGIDNALELSKVDKTSEIRIPWFYQKDENIITVILSKNTKTYKLQELLKLVVPIGTKIVIKPGYFVESIEEIRMHSWTHISCGKLDPDKQYYVTPNNYWKTEWDPDKQLYSTYIDEQWALSNPNNQNPQDNNKTRTGATRIGSIEVASNNYNTEELSTK